MKMGYYFSFMKKKASDFGKRIAAARKYCGQSQRDLARKVGISNRMIAYYEAQTNRPQAQKQVVELVELLAKSTGKAAQ
jgi:transcriptional regulator with XRE-family HTH domain